MESRLYFLTCMSAPDYRPPITLSHGRFAGKSIMMSVGAGVDIDAGNRQTVRRTVGFYDTEGAAREALSDPCADLTEGGRYEYAVIESVTSGTYPSAEESAWFRFIPEIGGKEDEPAGSWKEIERPKGAGAACNFSIG